MGNRTGKPLSWQGALGFVIVSIAVGCGFALAADSQTAPGRIMAQQAIKDQKPWITTDHSKHAILQQEFKSGPEVTKACLSCHSEAAAQVHKTIHWTWRDANADPAQGVGKGGISVNNFCIGLKSNWPRCTSCHAGYGWKDDTFDFTDQTKVDCLVCHDQTNTYKKFPAGAGNPAAEPTEFKGNMKTYHPPEWNKVAQSVGRPSRVNCGTCHFFGGGGDAVKHGDLDSSMVKPSKTLDVHMGVDGKNFNCTRCHTTQAHHVAGRIYSTPAATARKSLVQDDLATKITCESCHTDRPHQSGEKNNDHTDKVACQSCHIPAYARAIPTKMLWDWSKAGQMKDGKPFKTKGEAEEVVYDSQKGSFVWEKNVTPDYFWFNGSIHTLTAKDTIDPSGVVKVSWPVGGPDDPNARIFPFKTHRGKQPYDKVNKTILIPHLFGPPGSGAYWADYDWKKALENGMKAAGLPFSGEFDFVETTYVYPTTHMVAPKENVVACSQCHTRQGGRLANLAGFYMPGRDRNPIVTYAGLAMVAGSLVGVMIHGLGRFVVRGKKED